MEERKQITMAGLVHAILTLEIEQTLHFKRSCDYYGWGVKKMSVFNVPFIVLVEYSTGYGYSESLPANYRSSDFIKDFIWKALSCMPPSMSQGFYLISEEEANALGFLHEETILTENSNKTIKY